MILSWLDVIGELMLFDALIGMEKAVVHKKDGGIPQVANAFQSIQTFLSSTGPRRPNIELSALISVIASYATFLLMAASRVSR